MSRYRELAGFLFRVSRPHRGILVLIVVVSWLLLLPDLVVFGLLREAVNDGRLGAGITEWGSLLAAFLALYALKGVLAYVSNVRAIRLSYGITATVQEHLFDAVLSCDLDTYLQRRPGELLFKIISSSGYVQQIVLSWLRLTLTDGVLVVVYLAAIGLISPYTTLALVLLTIPYSALLLVQHRRVLDLARSSVASRSRWLADLDERFQFFEFIKAHHAEQAEGRWFRERTRDLVELETRVEIRRSLVGPFLELLVGLGVMVVVVVGLHQVSTGALSTGDVVAAAGLSVLVVRPLNRIVIAAGTLVQRFAHLEQVGELLIDPTPGTGGTGSYEVCQGPEPAVHVHGICMRRDGGESPLVDVTLDHVGTGLVAITGPSGGGKTTLARAVCGLITPTEGNIRVQVSRTEVPVIGYLPQDVRLLCPDVPGCIAYPDTRPQEDRVAELMELFALRSELADRAVGTDGAAISEGEKARVALANLLYHDREILVMDEPLEGVHEAEIDRAIQVLCSLAQRRLVIVISHHEPILAAATRVIFLSNGHIAAEGAHEELLHRDVAYRDNFRATTTAPKRGPDASA